MITLSLLDYKKWLRFSCFLMYLTERTIFLEPSPGNLKVLNLKMSSQVFAVLKLHQK